MVVEEEEERASDEVAKKAERERERASVARGGDPREHIG